MALDCSPEFFFKLNKPIMKPSGWGSQGHNLYKLCRGPLGDIKNQNAMPSGFRKKNIMFSLFKPM